MKIKRKIYWEATEERQLALKSIVDYYIYEASPLTPVQLDRMAKILQEMMKEVE